MRRPCGLIHGMRTPLSKRAHTQVRPYGLIPTVCGTPPSTACLRCCAGIFMLPYSRTAVARQGGNVYNLNHGRSRLKEPRL